jgi:hypothetical protein
MSGTTQTFSYTGTKVTYTVAADGWYRIDTFGAQGGQSPVQFGELGAEADGDVFLTAGEVLTVIVGGQGGSTGYGGGGGGGSFVIGPASTPLVIAGGGGGGSYGPSPSGGQAGTSGAAGATDFGGPNQYTGGAGGTAGQGGRGGTAVGVPYPGEDFTSDAEAGGGGGGLLTAGGDGSGTNASGGGGASALGTAGGGGGDNGGSGGFGGGGGAGLGAGGGGGGYSGGGGGAHGGGGGGGSFLATGAQNTVLKSGVEAGNGVVTITLVPAAQPSVISGTVPFQQITDATVQYAAFSGVTIADPNTGGTESVTVTPSVTANGTLTDSVGGTVDATTGVYTVSGTPGVVTAALRGLKFTPTAHQVAPNQTVTTTFTIQDVNSVGKTTTDSNTSVVATAVASAPTLKANPLSYTIAEGQTLKDLYQALVANVADNNFGAAISITSIGQPNTLGFAYLDKTDKLLTYTADGYQPGATQPQDSFTYTAADQYGQTVTGTVAVKVTGANVPTQVGTAGDNTLSANGAGQRLVGGNGNDTLIGNGSSQLLFGGNGNDTIIANGAKSTIWGGTGTNRITVNGSQQAVVLQQGGTDTISGFNLKNDVLDLTQVLAEVQKSYNASDFRLTTSGKDATLSYVGSPSFTGGAALATLVGVGPGVTLQGLIDSGALKIA